MGSSGTDLLEIGVTAAGDGRWADARSSLEGVPEETLTTDAAEALARARWWQEDPRGAIAAWEIAYTRRLDVGDRRGSSLIAVAIAREYALALGNEAATNGWLERAADALRDEGPCAELGWIDICEAVRAPDPASALRRADDALKLAKDFGERELEVYARAQLGIALVQSGRIDEGMTSFDSALAAATGGETGDPRALGDVFCGLVEACMLAADTSRVEQWIDVFNDYMARYQHPPLLTFCAVCDAEAQIAEGKWAQAEQTLVASLEAFDSGMRRARCIHPAALLAGIRVDQSRFEEADRLVDGLEDLPEMTLPRASLFLARGEPALSAAELHRRLNVVGRDNLLASPVLAVLVETELARGDTDAAAATAVELTTLSGRSERRQDLATAELAEGRVGAASGADRARSHLEKALELFGVLNMPLQAARTRMEIASLVRSSEPDLAIEEARVALSAFDEIGAVRDADIAAKLLRELGGVGRAGPKLLEQLTKREGEVLALVGQGLTNAEIAARLFISTKTAEHHVSNVLSKLGVRNRSEAASYAQRFAAGSDSK